MTFSYRIGTSGWHYDHWRQLFYPPKLGKPGWLEFYSRQFNTVELNNSFYRLPSEANFVAWYDTTPPDFIFAVKVSRFITHVKRLKNSAEAVAKFTDRAKLLKEKLGPLLYQLPPGMPRDDAVLVSFLSALPRGLRHVFEFRHPSWLVEPVFEILRRFDAGLCVFDMPTLRAPLVTTTDIAYFRFHGRGELYAGSYSDDDLADWAEKIAGLTTKLETVYIYFNNDIGGYALDNARTIRGYLRVKKGT